MTPESDAEKAEPERYSEEVETETSRENTPTPPPQVEGALAQVPDITAHGAPCANSENILDIVRRGRSGSRSSHSSDDSQSTLQDTGTDHQVPPHRVSSRAQSSTRSVRREAEKVPRSERRGLLGRFTIVAEVTDPYDYPRRHKWFLTFVIAVAGAAAPMASSIVLPALVNIEKNLHSTATIVNLSVALYMLSMSIFPLWWSSFSETLGRRTIYLASFTLYLVFNIIGALSTNVGMYLAMRVLAGSAGASVQAVGAGTIADIWEVRERGQAMGIFYLGPLCGPLLSPIIGGVLVEAYGWRSGQWFLAIMGAVILVFVLFCLPETLRQRKPVAAIVEEEAVEQMSIAATDEKGQGSDRTVRPALTRTTTTKSVQIKTKKSLAIFKRCFIDPLHIIVYLQFPAVAVCVGYSAITFASLYMLNISIQQTFSIKPYSYSSIIIGLLYMPNSVGYILTSIFGGRWVDRIMAREARKAGRYDEKGKLKYIPEDRMKENAWFGALLYPAALIVYGWSANYGVNVAVPLVANFFFGVGSMLIFAMVTTMLTEFMPRKASNGVALNNFVRNIFSCTGGALTDPLIQAMGNGWLFTMLGLLSLITGVLSVWSMKRYGPHWRITMDKRMASVQGD